MTCFRRRHALALAVALVACGSVEPVFPVTTLQTGSEGCTPADDDSADAGGTADTSGTTGASAPAPDGCDSSTGACVPGEESCPCTSGGACDLGLMCISEVCVQDECPIGTAGCPCTQGGGCDPDLSCVADLCTP
jgi:hypothetical protein